MGSADWMPRNLDRRVEILFPVEDEILKEKVIHILELELEDNVKAHILKPDGSYHGTIISEPVQDERMLITP